MTTAAAPALSGLPQVAQSQGMTAAAAAAESGSAVGEADETIVETPTAETPNPTAAQGEEVAEVAEGKDGKTEEEQ